MNKEEKYDIIMTQLSSLLSGESDVIAKMANMVAVIHHEMKFWWTGFYIVKSIDTITEEELILGPFQGPVACMHIKKGRGVCGKSWEKASTIVVENVNDFPGHIACSSESKSEIVVPIKKDGKVIAVLDIDSEFYENFDNIDKLNLEKIVALL